MNIETFECMLIIATITAILLFALTGILSAKNYGRTKNTRYFLYYLIGVAILITIISIFAVFLLKLDSREIVVTILAIIAFTFFFIAWTKANLFIFK